MFKKRKARQEEAAATKFSTPNSSNKVAAPPKPLPLQPASLAPTSTFARTSTAPVLSPTRHAAAPSPSIAAPLVSPLQMTFDFELEPPGALDEHFRPSEDSIARPSVSDSLVRPKTSDGVAGLNFSSTRPRWRGDLVASSSVQGPVGLAPPLLPAIPRVSSATSERSQVYSLGSEGVMTTGGGLKAGPRAKEDSDNLSTRSGASRKSTGIQLPSLRDRNKGLEHLLPPMPLPRTLHEKSSATSELRKSFVSDSSGRSTPLMMSASIFPPPAHHGHELDGSHVLPPISSGPAMTREFIDSRDKPYGQSRTSAVPAIPQQAPSVVRLPVQPPPRSSSMPNGLGGHGVVAGTSTPPPMPTLRSPASFNLDFDQRPGSSGGNSLRAPKISGARLSPNSSVEDLRLLQRSETNKTGVSAVSALSRTPTTEPAVGAGTPSLHSSAPRMTRATTGGTSFSPSLVASPSSLSPGSGTIGTPYQSTSSSFPLPQHVATRPKTAGATSRVQGVSIPTHHTSSLNLSLPLSSPLSATASTPSSAGPHSASSTDRQGVSLYDKPMASPPPPAPIPSNKRKTRLLNPMALLSRRKSSQTPEETPQDRSNAAQAYARQQAVTAQGGVVERGLPKDFDPRIRGKVVHDFSAPRQVPPRGFSYEESLDLGGLGAGVASRPGHVQQRSDGALQDVVAGRRSTHSPSLFREHFDEPAPGGEGAGLGDAEAEARKRASMLNAERLENSAFLQRVSHHSSNHSGAFSVESGVLPPFARRSQVMDQVAQAGGSRPAEAGKRESDSSSGVSPVTQRSSGAPAQFAGAGARDSVATSFSPVSPHVPDQRFRPMSSVSDLSSRKDGEVSGSPSLLGLGLGAAGALAAGSGVEVADQTRGRTVSEASARPLSDPAATLLPKASTPSAITRERSPYRNSAEAPEVFSPTIGSFANQLRRTSSQKAADLLDLPIPLPGHTFDLTTPEMTPEVGTATFASAVSPSQKSGPRVVEKRASAVGHAHRGSSSAGKSVIKKRVSNASRFSFQFGESTGEEFALEEKHRQIRRSQGNGMAEEGEEEEDEFDEDALDDLDEFEMEQSAGVGAEMEDDDDDGGSVYSRVEDGEATRVVKKEEVTDKSHRHLTWAEHPDMRGYSALGLHSRDHSLPATNEAEALQRLQGGLAPISTTGHHRAASGASGLTIDTGPPTGDANAEFVQDSYTTNNSVPRGVAGARPRSGFYMQPHAAGYAPGQSPVSAGAERREKPVLPHRDSGNSERNRTTSGMSFGSSLGNGNGSGVDRQRASTIGGRSSGALGASGMSDFAFSETGLDLSLNGTRPTSLDTVDQQQQKAGGRGWRDSETIPAHAGWAELERKISPEQQRPRTSGYFTSPNGKGVSQEYRGTIGQGIRDRQSKGNQNLQDAPSDSEEGEDDMYFDDGGFEQDLRTQRQQHRFNEDDIDQDGFLNGYNRLGAHMYGGQQRGSLAFTSAATGDGPYPTFAMGANPIKARQRESQMLLEDLPLVGPVDPALIPQRNPSEDAKRLGLSSRVPPLPLQGTSREAANRLQSKLEAYHAALAEAANKAAAEGRFARQASVSTSKSLLHVDEEDRDDHSTYSRDMDGAEGLSVPVDDSLSRSISDQTSGSKISQQNASYSPPPKLSFDFGFGEQHMADTLGLSDSIGLSDGLEDTLDDSFAADDDIIAAANAEALASDDSGFYGQEFGFYANARPNSGEVAAINGGFFGMNGDDGLQRNKSSREPNLTPITERTEMSARNSFFGGPFGPASVGLMGPASPALARLPLSPLVGEGGVMDLEQLRRLRGNAFAGSNGGGLGSPALGAKGGSPSQGYFGIMGGTPASSAPNSAHPQLWDSPITRNGGWQDSPQSGTSSLQFPWAGVGGAENEATPRKAQQAAPESPATARKVPGAALSNGQGHARKGSDSVTYVKESDSNGQPRWVLERRKTSEFGEVELVGREVVKAGWI